MKKTLLLLTVTLLFSSISICQVFDIYVSDAVDFSSGSGKIFKFDENGENGEIFIDEELSWPQDILFLENQGIVLISNLITNKITKYDSEQGDYLGDFATGIDGPTRMKIGADSLLYVLQWGGSGYVKRFQLDGTFLDDYTTMGVTQSIGIDWDTDSNLYVSSYSGNLIQKFDDTGLPLEVFTNSSLQGPTNIWFDDNGDLFACNWNGTTVSRFDSDGNFIENFITGLSNPEGVDIYPNGNIIIGNGGSSAVKLFDEDGNYIEDIIASGATGLVFPNAVVLREQTTVSIAQIDQEINFIHPSIGSSFFLNSSLALNIESIEVYNYSGILIKKRLPANQLLWDANNYPDGLYFILARSENGQSYSQKVHVKK